MNAVRKNKTSTRNNLFKRDIWKAEELGLQPDSINGMYHFNFSRLHPKWLKKVVKKFVHYQSATRSFATCYSYINRLNPFAVFLSSCKKNILPTDINRKLIVKYISFLASSNIGIVSKNMCLTHIRTLHSVILQEKWLKWPTEPLVFSSDLVAKIEHVPKFIPEFVMSQLHKNIHHLPEYMQNLIIILLETGRRLGEICAMPYDCLSKDEQGDYFLKINDKKLKKSYLIPIADECIDAIKSQQQLVKKSSLLFPARNKQKTAHISGRWVNESLNQLAKEHKILDENGNIWGFHSHQFRHTLGTRMINSSVPQTIVQKYLGHESAEMTARYAYIHNETMKKAFNEYQGELVNIQGKATKIKNSRKFNDAKWLKHNVMSQALPNGICGLPSPQQSCPHANACLSCVHFRTHKDFLPQHKKQLQMTNKIIAEAKKNDWNRQYEMNIKVKQSLESIIKSFKG